MAIYPLIESPCPYKGRLSDILDADICRLCKREVHDLTDMSDRARRKFLKACSGEVCVSYRVAAGTVLAISALATGALAAPSASAQADPTEHFDLVFVGGLKRGDEAVIVGIDDDDTSPELPVIFEAPPQSKAKAAEGVHTKADAQLMAEVKANTNIQQ